MVHRARNLHQQLGQALLQFLTRRVNLVPLRDVDISAGDALRSRLTCALHDASTHLHPDPMAVLVAQPGLCLEEFGLPANMGLEGITPGWPILRVDQRLELLMVGVVGFL